LIGGLKATVAAYTAASVSIFTFFAMHQTPVHRIRNAELLKLMPIRVRGRVEMGCGSGALARKCRKLNLWDQIPPSIHQPHL
jgi:hypothetical protein